MIILLALILTVFCLVMTVVSAIRKDYEKAGTFLACAGMFYIAYSTSMNFSDFEHKAEQLEWLVKMGILKML